jgi:imidazoleglycerol phosphate dehydratase HisB
MDEWLGFVAVDLGGRPYAVFDAEFVTPRVGNLGTDLIFHLFESIAIGAAHEFALSHHVWQKRPPQSQKPCSRRLDGHSMPPLVSTLV